MSDTISISVSAAAIFSALETWDLPPPRRKDMMLELSWTWQAYCSELLAIMDETQTREVVFLPCTRNCLMIGWY
jgi:hypothetical protein